jgi:hypothetical protein
MRPGVRAVVSVALAEGEAEAFFAPGQRFTIWADAVIGQTIRAGGLAGSGVISCPVSLPPPHAHDVRALGWRGPVMTGFSGAAAMLPGGHLPWPANPAAG